MATRQFADLSSYRRGVDSAKATGNALDSLLQGFQSGVQLQQLPQRMQAEELAMQLQNAINAQKLRDLQDPEGAILRQIQKELTVKGALNPNLGIVRAPTGLEGQTIATPSALTTTQQTALEAGGAIPSVAPGAPETPISVFGRETGFNVNPNIPEQAEEDKLQRDLRRISARQSPSEEKSVTYRDLGNSIVALDSKGNEVSRIAKDVNESSRMTARGLYVFKQNDPLNGRIVPGTEPLPKSSSKKDSGGIKTTAEERKTFKNTAAAFMSLKDLGDKVTEINKTGKFPGSAQVFINQALSKKPSDIPGAGLIPGASEAYAVIQQKLKKAQTPESRQYEAIRAELTASIIRAQAGLSQTLGEVENVIPYTPQVNDTVESLMDKLENLKRLADRELNLSQMMHPDLRQFKIPGFKRTMFAEDEESPIIEEGSSSDDAIPEVDGTDKIPTLSSNENYASEAEARAAGHQNGDVIIMNGEIGILE